MPIVFNAAMLATELLIPVANVNDDAFHWAFIQRGIDALRSGENVLEFWVPQLGLGFPQFLYYQHLPHLAVIALHALLFGAVDAYFLFNLVRYLLLVLLPLTVFWSLRRMDLPPAAAAIGAAASALLSTDHLYGFDYDSYVWRGFGMYTQLWAMHLSFVTLACAYRLIQHGRGYVAAVVALSALALSHILYAYMAVITIGVIALVGIDRANGLPRLARVVALGAATAAITSYAWLPTAQSASLFLDFSPYLERWKYDGFGAPRVLALLVNGELFDLGRPPVFTVLVGIGAIAAIVTRTRVAITALALFAVWLVLFFGRPTLGPIADLFPLKDSLYFHRFIGSVHLAGVVLIAVGGGWLWSLVRAEEARWRLGAATAVAALALVPAMSERYGYYTPNREWMEGTYTAIQSDAEGQRDLATVASLPSARTYAGLRTNWGPSLNFDLPFRSVRMHHMLTVRGLPEVAPPYSGPSLNSDLLYDFDESRAEHYDLFDARYVIAPSQQPMPSFLTLLARGVRYALYQAPTSGFAEYVAVADRREVSSQALLFPQNRAWLGGPDAGRRFIRWDYPVRSDRSLGESRPACANGRTLDERVRPSRLDLVVDCPTAGTLLIKVTYHPNWQVAVDGATVPTFMLSPSYLGIELAPGRHQVTAQYRSTPAKIPLLLLGALGLAGTVLAARRYDGREGWWSR